MLSVREYLVLHGEERAAGVHQVDAGEVVFHGDFLCPEMFFYRDRIVGTTSDGRIIGDDDDLPSMDDAYPGNNPRSRGFVVVHIVRRKGVELHERRLRVEQGVD